MLDLLGDNIDDLAMFHHDKVLKVLLSLCQFWIMLQASLLM